MRLDLTRIQRNVEAIDRRYAPEDFGPPSDDFAIVGPVSLVGTAQREGKTAILLDARVTTSLEMACGRCLEPFRVPVDVAFETKFVPAEELAAVTAAAVEHDVEGNPPGLDGYRDEAIDLGAVMREQFYLAAPMKPLCRPDCLGLCAQCGVNRNRETCTCQVTWEDPRLAPLKALKRKMDGGSDAES